MLLLRTLAGSRLYGTNQPYSDFDYYEVYDDIKPSQTIKDGVDITRMPFEKWLYLCHKGSHQALDAMWCPPEFAEVDELWYFRSRYRNPLAAAQLEATAHSMGEGSKHFERLLACARECRRYGYYNPRRT